MDPSVIISIMLTADGGCSVCTRDLLKSLGESYPEYRTAIKVAYAEAHPGSELPSWES